MSVKWWLALGIDGTLPPLRLYEQWLYWGGGAGGGVEGGANRDEVTGEWRKLHNEELNDMYSSTNIVRAKKSRKTRWAGHVARMGERRGVSRVLVGRPEGKRPLGSSRR